MAKIRNNNINNILVAQIAGILLGVLLGLLIAIDKIDTVEHVKGTDNIIIYKDDYYVIKKIDLNDYNIDQ